MPNRYDEHARNSSYSRSDYGRSASAGSYDAHHTQRTPRERVSVRSDAFASADSSNIEQYRRSNYGHQSQFANANSGSSRAHSVHREHTNPGSSSRSRETRPTQSERRQQTNRNRTHTSDSTTSRSYAVREARTQRKKSKLPIIGGVVLVVLLAIGIGVFKYISTISDNLHQGITDDVRDVLVETKYAEEPFYMLLMGTDKSQAREEEGTYGVYRSDSMMLCRVDCVNKKVSIISLQRDTLVDMGEYGMQKLNAASLIGGPSYAIEKINELAGVQISHFAMVDFDGFEAIVDAVGGVEVDVPIEINDPDAGGYVAAGKQVLTGEQALILCRSRHTYDSYGAGDNYRAANQRMVLSALANKILGADLATIASSVTTLSQYVTTDFELTDIVGLAQAMRGIDMTSDIYTAMQPTESVYENGMWYDVTIEDEWKTMMDRVNQGLSPTEGDIVDPTGTVLASSGSGSQIGGSSANVYTNVKSGSVTVYNGNGKPGASSAGASVIANMGYTTETGNAQSYDYEHTLVIFNDVARRSEAEEIAQQLGAGCLILNNGAYQFSSDFLVIVGADRA